MGHRQILVRFASLASPPSPEPLPSFLLTSFNIVSASSCKLGRSFQQDMAWHGKHTRKAAFPLRSCRDLSDPWNRPQARPFRSWVVRLFGCICGGPAMQPIMLAAAGQFGHRHFFLPCL